MRTEAIASRGLAPARTAGSVELSSTSEAVQAVGTGDSVSVGWYVLRRANGLVGALERAAARPHARVQVRIGAPFADEKGQIGTANEAVAKALRAAGVDVTETKQLEHLKAAAVDQRAFLSDRNWARNGIVLVDDRPSDVRAVRRALQSGKAPRASADFAVAKKDALRLEGDVLASAKGTPLDVETETISTDSSVELKLLDAARHGSVRLVVAPDGVKNEGELRALRQLAGVGVKIRIGNDDAVGNDKFCVTGNRAWVGSANATGCVPGTHPLDWGLRTHARSIVDALHRQFHDDWHDSHPFRFVA